MSSEPLNEWISIYNDGIQKIWNVERTELRKISMIFGAFHQELEKLKCSLSEELFLVKSALRKKDLLQKRKKFSGLVQSEKFDVDFINEIYTDDEFDKSITDLNRKLQPEIDSDDEIDKENFVPSEVPLKKQEFEIKTEDLIFEFPNVAAIKNRLSSPQCSKNISSSPVLRKESFTRNKRKKSVSPPSLSSKTPKTEQPTCDNVTPENPDHSIMECSIIDDTPTVKTERKLKRPLLGMKRGHKKKFNKSLQTTTLTQMFFEPKKVKKEIDSNLPSMSVTEMIKLINDSDSETDAELELSDETIDGLQVPKPSQAESMCTSPVKNSQEKSNVGCEEKKAKKWSCRDCKEYYEGSNLSREELQKKMNQCAEGRHVVRPEQETYDGFWDLTFGPTPNERDDEKSLILNYKKQ